MKKTIILLVLLAAGIGLNVAAQTNQDIDNTPDPIASLRDEIGAAPNASERNRLQLKLADLLLTKGQKVEALAELNAIASSDSFDPIGFYNLGNFYARIGENEQAIAAYRTAIEQRNGKYSRALNNLGVVLLRVGRWDDAQESLLSALKIENFRYAEASYNLGRVYAALGQNDLAAREWRRALVVNPEHDAAKEALALGAEGRIEVRPKTASRKPAVRQPADVKTATAKPVSIRPAAARESKPLTLDQISFEFLQRARDAAERGKLVEAVDGFRRVLKREGGYFGPANLEMSYALLHLKRYDEALVNLLEVTRRDGARYPISYYHLARLYELKSELKLAEAAFAQATIASPKNPQFLLDLSRVREKLGEFEGALEAMDRYLALVQEQKPLWFDERVAELRRKAGK